MPGNAPGWRPTIARMPATGPRPIRGPGSPPAAAARADGAIAAARAGTAGSRRRRRSRRSRVGSDGRALGDREREERTAASPGPSRRGARPSRTSAVGGVGAGSGAVGVRMPGSRGVRCRGRLGVAFGSASASASASARGSGVGFGVALGGASIVTDPALIVTSLPSLATAVRLTAWRPAGSLPDQRNVTPLPHEPPGRRLISWPAPPNDTRDVLGARSVRVLVDDRDHDRRRRSSRSAATRWRPTAASWCWPRPAGPRAGRAGPWPPRARRTTCAHPALSCDVPCPPSSASRPDGSPVSRSRMCCGQGGAMVRGSGCETPSGAAAVLDGACRHHAWAVRCGLVLTVVRPPRVDGPEW